MAIRELGEFGLIDVIQENTIFSPDSVVVGIGDDAAAIRPPKDKLELFLQVHNRSMEIARQISDIIGPEDTENFIRIADKMANSGYHL